MWGLPNAPMVFHRWSSAILTTMFGRLAMMRAG
jgi:hypothetical protein